MRSKAQKLKGRFMSYIEMSHISKRFATVLANDDVSLHAERGEILALLGENGSGKSTLMNMLSGIYIPDEGSISIRGKPRSFRSPQDAIAARVGMVHQHFKLVPVMAAWENISLGERRGVAHALPRRGAAALSSPDAPSLHGKWRGRYGGGTPVEGVVKDRRSGTRGRQL
jgi:ABC-type uncharacterized transport system ATPase subunit